jgi:hypothetical protein
MKGTCYSGIVNLPEHPDADMHGLIRVAIRDRSTQAVVTKLEEAGIRCKGLWGAYIWQESRSHAELVATEWHYGKLLACPITLQYISPDNYRPIPKDLLRGKRNGIPNTKPRSGITPEKF